MSNNLYKKQVACNFDGASFQLRNEEGIQAKIYRRQTGCVHIWCIAHRLELAFLEDVKHNDYSPKPCQKFKNLGEQLDKLQKNGISQSWTF